MSLLPGEAEGAIDERSAVTVDKGGSLQKRDGREGNVVGRAFQPTLHRSTFSDHNRGRGRMEQASKQAISPVGTLITFIFIFYYIKGG